MHFPHSHYIRRAPVLGSTFSSRVATECARAASRELAFKSRYFNRIWFDGHCLEDKTSIQISISVCKLILNCAITGVLCYTLGRVIFPTENYYDQTEIIRYSIVRNAIFTGPTIFVAFLACMKMIFIIITPMKTNFVEYWIVSFRRRLKPQKGFENMHYAAQSMLIP